MADNPNTFSDLSADAVLYIRDELLSIAEKNVVFAQHAMKATLPQHSSKTIQFSRYPRLPLPTKPATEGVTPDGLNMSVETVTAVVDQWIMLVTLTDLAVLTIKHPLVPVVTDLLGLAQAELVDREIQKALMADATVSFTAGRTSRASLTSSDVVTATELKKLWAKLRRNGARQIGMNYVLIVDPEVAQDISDESKFRNAHELAKATAIFNNMIGAYEGFAVEVSNFIPTITLGAAGDWTIVSKAGTGTFSVNEVVNAKIEAVNADTGLVEKVYAAKSDTIDTGHNTIDITVPSTAGFVYNVWVSAVDNNSADANMVLVQEAVAPSTVVTVLDFPTATTSPKPQATPPSGVTVHTSYAFGRDSYGMVNLSGDNLRVMITPNAPSDSDPAAQRRKLSLKGSFKALVLNADWIIRLESASAF